MVSKKSQITFALFAIPDVEGMLRSTQMKGCDDMQGSVIEVIKNTYLFFDYESFFLTLINTYQDPYEKSLERQWPTLRRKESTSHSHHYLCFGHL